MIKNIRSFLFRKNLYFTLVFILFIAFIFVSRIYKLDLTFISYYSLNHSAINNSFISLFGVLFAFLFTIMSIIFSLNKDSLFIELMEKTNRTKKDIINYFTLALISFSAVIILSLFFIIIGNGSFLFLIYLLFYSVTFSLLNLIIFLTTFILILKS